MCIVFSTAEHAIWHLESMEILKKADQWLKELNSKENLLNCVTVVIMVGNQV